MKALIGQAAIFLRNDLVSLLESLSLKTEITECSYADDVSVIRSQLSSLLSSPKSVEDHLKKISHELLQNHSHSAEALQCCLQISIKLNSKLMAQKITTKLRALGFSVEPSVIDSINSGREGYIRVSIPAL